MISNASGLLAVKQVTRGAFQPITNQLQRIDGDVLLSEFSPVD